MKLGVSRAIFHMAGFPLFFPTDSIEYTQLISDRLESQGNIRNDNHLGDITEIFALHLHPCIAFNTLTKKTTTLPQKRYIYFNKTVITIVYHCFTPQFWNLAHVKNRLVDCETLRPRWIKHISSRCLKLTLTYRLLWPIHDTHNYIRNWNTWN